MTAGTIIFLGVIIAALAAMELLSRGLPSRCQGWCSTYGTSKNFSAVAVLLFVSPAMADINGSARVIDGDTIDIAGERIRLHGIDAPESAQTCIADGERWPCGQRATDALAAFIGGVPVRCEEQGTDRYGRTIAACTVQGEDIESWMVLNGWALAYRQYSLDYVGEEAAAQDAQAGVWSGEFVLPWEWRRGVRLEQ